MNPARIRNPSPPAITAVDLFCGESGLTRGLLDAGIPVVAGYTFLATLSAEGFFFSKDADIR
jgi:hypothetical protein